MHIEPTSRCTLACPACPRTWFTEKFDRAFPKQDLDLEHLKKFLDCESGEKISGFMLNGNHGDPIYYPDLINLIDNFRTSKSFRISTNGSYQKEEFWENLAARMTEKDTIYFSIDGLEHNNHLYRRNSDWKSIMEGLEIMTKSRARVVWKTIVFSYNETEIDKIKQLAESKGAIFVAHNTSRFGHESLIPTNQQLIDSSRLYQNNQTIEKLEPQCFEQEYISADGYYWPCCLITSYYTLHKTVLWKNRNDWSIDSQNLDEAREKLSIWKQSIIEEPNNAHPVCKMSCKPGQNFSWTNI
jgi:MoaA/NifB/PqqE/SkfB family radical SAM enzyme